MTFDDELLLTTLGGALETRTAQPSAAELEDFRALVRGDGGDILPFPEPIGRRAGHRRARTVLVAAALAASLAVVGGAGALATGTTLPNVLRAPVRALGINVDDSAVAQTRSAMAELRSALGSTDDARVRAAALTLAAKLRALSVSDRTEFEAEADPLLRAAADRQNPGMGQAQTETTQAPPTTGPVAAADPAPPGGDTAGDESSGSSGTDGAEAESPEDETAPTATTEPEDDPEPGAVDG